MRTIAFTTSLAATLLLIAVSGGCGSQQSDDRPSTSGGHDHDHDHAHGEEHQGPHGGHLIELGRNHEYHAELVDDEQAGTVTVYILDKDLMELLIEQQAITLNLVVEGETKTFELTAADGSGAMASRFEAADKAVFEALHELEASGKLRVMINGSPYSGDIEHHDHHHDSHDEDHDHGDENEH